MLEWSRKKCLMRYLILDKMKNFIEMNCFVYNKAIADMGMEQEDETVRLLVDLDDLSGIRETVGEDDEIDEDCCIIFLKSGESFVVDVGYEGMKKKLKKESFSL